MPQYRSPVPIIHAISTSTLVFSFRFISISPVGCYTGSSNLQHDIQNRFNIHSPVPVNFRHFSHYASVKYLEKRSQIAFVPLDGLPCFIEPISCIFLVGLLR